MTLADAIVRYRVHLDLLNYSPATVKSYCFYLGKCAAFLESLGVPDIEAVTADHLIAYQKDIYYRPTIYGRARCFPSQNQFLIAVKNLFRFLHEDHVLAHNPAAGLPLAREPDRLPKNILTPREAKKILEAPDIESEIGYRDRTILEVLYATGIRKAELLALNVADINLEEQLLRVVHGKGAKDRVVPLSPIACQFLETYLHAIRPEFVRGRAIDALFISTESNRLGRTTLDAIIEKYRRKARIKKKVTPHVWRHTCATHLLQGKANLRHVQELLGHRDITTTQKYLRLTITELKTAHAKHHPRG